MKKVEQIPCYLAESGQTCIIQDEEDIVQRILRDTKIEKVASSEIRVREFSVCRIRIRPY